MGCPIRRPQDHSLVAGSPVLFVGSNVLHRLLMPRHPSCALVRSRQPGVETRFVLRLSSLRDQLVFRRPGICSGRISFRNRLATIGFHRQLSHFTRYIFFFLSRWLTPPRLVAICSFLLATPCKHVTLGSVLRRTGSFEWLPTLDSDTRRRHVVCIRLSKIRPCCTLAGSLGCPLRFNLAEETWGRRY